MGTNRGTSLPNYGPGGGSIPTSPSGIGPGSRTWPTSSPIMPQKPAWWNVGGPGSSATQNRGDVAGGGSPESQASTAAFNNWLLGQINSGTLGNLISGMQNPNFNNQYMRLLQPGARAGMSLPGTGMPPTQPPITGKNPIVSNPMDLFKGGMPNGLQLFGGMGETVYQNPNGGIQYGGGPRGDVLAAGGIGLADGSPVNTVAQPPLNYGNPGNTPTPGQGPAYNAPPPPNPTTGGPYTYQGGSPYLDNGGVNLGNVNGVYNPATYNPFTMGGMGLGGSANLADAGSADVNGKFGTAVQDVMNRQMTRDIADLRNRYGMSGGSNLGSGTQLAEGNYRAEALPQIAAALGQINLQERGLNLTQRGQDLQNYLGSRGLDVNQLGLMQNESQFGNTFGQRNAEFGANFGQNAQQLNNQNMLNNAQQMNSYGLGMGAIGMQQAQMQQNAMLAAYQQMMHAYEAQAGWNTPQAENVVKPSDASQWLAFLNGLSQIYGNVRNR